MSGGARAKVGYVLGTWFGCGRVPYAPGTAGTLGAIPLYLLIRGYGTLVVLAVAALITAVGVWAWAASGRLQTQRTQRKAEDEIR